MKKIISNKLYDTDTAEPLGGSTISASILFIQQVAA